MTTRSAGEQGSILSFPERGKWGRADYRGNCSGHVYRRIFEALRPAVFTDPMVGGGTSVEVAREMGIEAYGLDLHSGFNILARRILDEIGKPSDLVLSHPPYHNIILYSGKVWGKEPHEGDLSRCATEEEFLDKLTIAMKNQPRDQARRALRDHHRRCAPGRAVFKLSGGPYHAAAQGGVPSRARQGTVQRGQRSE